MRKFPHIFHTISSHFPHFFLTFVREKCRAATNVLNQKFPHISAGNWPDSSHGKCEEKCKENVRKVNVRKIVRKMISSSTSAKRSVAWEQ